MVTHGNSTIERMKSRVRDLAIDQQYLLMDLSWWRKSICIHEALTCGGHQNERMSNQTQDLPKHCPRWTRCGEHMARKVLGIACCYDRTWGFHPAKRSISGRMIG